MSSPSTTGELRFLFFGACAMDEQLLLAQQVPYSAQPGCVISFAGPQGRRPMAWTTPTLIEICIGLEINGYLPAEF